MARYFVRDGKYFETITDIETWPDDGREVVEQRLPPAPVVDPVADLTRAEFNGMLAAKGFKTVWDAMRVALLGVDTEEAEEFRFLLEANLHARFYRLAETLALVGQFREFATSLNADYAALLTDDNITTAWRSTVARRTA